MSEPRPTLVTAAQLARVLNLTRSRVSQLRYSEGCPVVETSAGDRYDLEKVIPWYMGRKGTPAETTAAGTAPADPHAEAMSGMRTVVHRAIQQHVDALTTDRGLTRFIETLQALGLDARNLYFARRTVQLWLGTTLPAGEAAVVMESPEGGPPSQWEAEWRHMVARVINGDQETPVAHH